MFYIIGVYYTTQLKKTSIGNRMILWLHSAPIPSCNTPRRKGIFRH